jgi:hypothetical protein
VVRSLIRARRAEGGASVGAERGDSRKQYRRSPNVVPCSSALGNSQRRFRKQRQR